MRFINRTARGRDVLPKSAGSKLRRGTEIEQDTHTPPLSSDAQQAILTRPATTRIDPGTTRGTTRTKQDLPSKVRQVLFSPRADGSCTNTAMGGIGAKHTRRGIPTFGAIPLNGENRATLTTAQAASRRCTAS